MRCFCCDIELYQTVQTNFNKYTDREETYHLCNLCEKSYFSQKIIANKLNTKRGNQTYQIENQEIFKELMILGHNMVKMLRTEIVEKSTVKGLERKSK